MGSELQQRLTIVLLVVVAVVLIGQYATPGGQQPEAQQLQQAAVNAPAQCAACPLCPRVPERVCPPAVAAVAGGSEEAGLPPVDLKNLPDVADLVNMPAVALPEEYASVYYAMLRRTLVAACPGDLCNFDFKGTPGPLFDFMRKPFQCRPLMTNPLAGLPAWIWPPAKNLPAVFRDDFTMGGRFPVHQTTIYKQRQGGATPKQGQRVVTAWTHEIVEHWKSRVPADRGSVEAWKQQWDATGNYGFGDAKCLYDAVSTDDPALSVKGKRVAVVGSILPWVEGILLAAGVAHITTIEYGAIDCTHPQVDTVTPLQLTAAINDGKAIPQFDGIVSYSSLEHSGLGRYGDELNPWGDIMAVAQVWCMTKPDGFFHVSFEMARDVGGRGGEGMVFNAHRSYGKNRMPHVLANWEFRKQTCPGTIQPTVSMVKVPNTV